MRIVLLLSPLLLAGCVIQPQTFAPTVQRRPALDGQAPKPLRQIVEMSDPDADAMIVQDIQRGDNSPWRWTGKKPTVRIFVTSVDGLTLKVHYTVPDATFRDTGPVNLTFLVNDKPLAGVAVKAPGEKRFEQAIPPEMLRANADNMFAVELDKLWVSKSDGAKLGMLLNSVELTH